MGQETPQLKILYLFIDESGNFDFSRPSHAKEKKRRRLLRLAFGEKRRREKVKT